MAGNQNVVRRQRGLAPTREVDCRTIAQDHEVAEAGPAIEAATDELEIEYVEEGAPVARGSTQIPARLAHTLRRRTPTPAPQTHTKTTATMPVLRTDDLKRAITNVEDDP